MVIAPTAVEDQRQQRCAYLRTAADSSCAAASLGGSVRPATKLPGEVIGMGAPYGIPLLAAAALSVGMAASATVVELGLGPPGRKVLSAAHFGANAEFFRPDLYFGTLPADDPRSTRAAFVEALHRSGIRSLRFPAGNPSYYYLAESAPLTMELAHATGHWEYVDSSPGSAGFVSLESLCSLAREAGIGLIYELPVLFHLDGATTPRATIRSSLSDVAGNYDRDRIEDCVAYGCGVIRRLRALGAPVLAWELGNEEFALCEAGDYRRLCEAYIPAIRRLDAKTPIVAVGMGAFGSALAGVSGVDALNAHYPFGNWPGPPSADRRGDAAAFAGGDLCMDRWLGSPAGWRRSATPWAVSETMVMHHEFWDPSAVVTTQAHALTYARNWMTLLEHPGCTMAVFHDLATPYFGMMRFNVGYDAVAGQFGWLAADALPGPWTRTFPMEYVLSPTCLANRMLSTLEGARVTPVGLRPDVPEARFTAGVLPDGTRRLVGVNWSAEPLGLCLRVRGKVRAEVLTATTLAAKLPEEFGVSALPVEPSANGGWVLTVPGESVVWGEVAERG
ncbi:MAG TPA: hypothetical protein PLQ54_04935 [Armatimonadota bacterium]|nr:hypothetical protein [Armatimonadota bacterium]